jgi:peptidoglycan-associated lipoprotein
MLGRLRVFLAVGGLFLGVGCKPEYPACKRDKHCNTEAGEKCVDGLCQNCTTDEDCVGKGPQGANWVCHEFRCTDPAKVPAASSGAAGEVGAPCTQASECSGGLVCREGKCDVCTQDADCPEGTCNLDTGRCAGSVAGGQCTTDDNCAMDEICDQGTCVFSGSYGQDGTVLCELKAIYFDFDSPKIKPEAEAALKAAAQCIAQQNRLVYLEAHADPRGTEEYNILLTDRRGQSVKELLKQLGVAAENMQVIAKGSLEATGTDDASWAQDRRVQFVWP